MKNNMKNSPKTNVIGWVLLGAGLIILAISILYKISLDLSEYGGVFGLISAGVLFLLGMSDEALQILKLKKTTNKTQSKMDYQETLRTTTQTSDGYDVKYFTWTDSNNPNGVNEVQYIESDASSSTGIFVYWRTYTNITEFTNNTLDHFKNNSFPKKKVKRGGTPTSS